MLICITQSRETMTPLMHWVLTSGKDVRFKLGSGVHIIGVHLVYTEFHCGLLCGPLRFLVWPHTRIYSALLAAQTDSKNSTSGWTGNSGNLCSQWRSAPSWTSSQSSDQSTDDSTGTFHPPKLHTQTHMHARTCQLHTLQLNHTPFVELHLRQQFHTSTFHTNALMRRQVNSQLKFRKSIAEYGTFRFNFGAHLL